MKKQDEAKKDVCSVCGAESDGIRFVLPVYGGSYICDKCLKKQGKIYLSYRWQWGRQALSMPYEKRHVEISVFGDTYRHKDMISDRGFKFKDGVWVCYTTPASAIQLHGKLAKVMDAYDGYSPADDEYFSQGNAE